MKWSSINPIPAKFTGEADYDQAFHCDFGKPYSDGAG